MCQTIIEADRGLRRADFELRVTGLPLTRTLLPLNSAFRAAYLLEPETEPTPLRVAPGIRLLAGGLITAMVVIGVYPTQLIEMAQSAARMLRFY